MKRITRLFEELEKENKGFRELIDLDSLLNNWRDIEGDISNIGFVEISLGLKSMDLSYFGFYDYKIDQIFNGANSLMRAIESSPLSLPPFREGLVEDIRALLRDSVLRLIERFDKMFCLYITAYPSKYIVKLPNRRVNVRGVVGTLDRTKYLVYDNRSLRRIAEDKGGGYIDIRFELDLNRARQVPNTPSKYFREEVIEGSSMVVVMVPKEGSTGEFVQEMGAVVCPDMGLGPGSLGSHCYFYQNVKNDLPTKIHSRLVKTRTKYLENLMKENYEKYNGNN